MHVRATARWLFSCRLPLLTGRGARRGQRLACFGSVARAGARGVGHLDLGGNFGRPDRDHGGFRRGQHRRPDTGALDQLSGRLRRHPADLSCRRRDRRQGRPQELLVEHDHRGDGLLRPLSRGTAVRPVRRRLALASGADRRDFAVDHLGRRCLRGHGRDRPRWRSAARAVVGFASV